MYMSSGTPCIRTEALTSSGVIDNYFDPYEVDVFDGLDDILADFESQERSNDEKGEEDTIL